METAMKHASAAPVQHVGGSLKTMDIKMFHSLVGHPDTKFLEETATLVGLKLTAVMGHCEGCGHSKAKAARVSKVTNVRADQPGSRLFIDTSGPCKHSVIGSKCWFLVVDDATRKAWSFFGKKKDHLEDKIKELLIFLKGKGIKVQFVRCDNAGENTAGLQSLCTKWGVNMEFTAPHTPKHNGVVKRMFITL